MRARTLTRAAIATLVLTAVMATPAAARLVRHVSSFTPAGVAGLFGVAVDQATGEVYVVGKESGNVERFSATGTPEASFVSPVLSEPAGVAVDNSADASKGDVYVVERGTFTVVKLDPSGKPVAGFTPIAKGSIPVGDVGSGSGYGPFGVAVDPANGDILLDDSQNSEIDIFSSSGTFISQFSAGSASLVAVGAGSTIFTALRGVFQWSPPYTVGTPIGPVVRTHGIATDLVTGELFGEQEGETGYEIVEYNDAGAPLLRFGAGLVEGSFGVAVNEATDTVYATSPESGAVEVFGPPEVVANVVTGTPATGVTSTAADIGGTINPEGSTVTSCSFEYGLSTSYGYTSPCAPAPPLTGNTAIPIAAGLASLQPDETYHYQLVGSTAGGPSYGEDETFQTPSAPPAIQSESVSALRQTSATLDALINPNNQGTTYHFEYGPTAAYGTVLPVPDAGIGSEYGNIVVGEELSGLQPGTTYHFRVVARNASSPAGGTPGPDQTFTTPPAQPPIVSTGQAVGVAQSTATITGTVDTQGFQTVYEFDVGTDTGYGSRIFGNASTTLGVQTFTVTLQDLAPGTTYHYRIAATNSFGTTYGVDVAFTTGTFLSGVLTEPVSEPFVPAILLAPAPGGGSAAAKAAKAAVVKLAAHTARHAKGKRSGGGRGLRGRGGRAGKRDRAEGANRGGGK